MIFQKLAESSLHQKSAVAMVIRKYFEYHQFYCGNRSIDEKRADFLNTIVKLTESGNVSCDLTSGLHIAVHCQDF